MDVQKTKQKILIVEDEIIIAMDLRSKLENLGFSVTEIVSNSDDALLSAEKAQPDLVLMDIRIKGKKDGIETAILLKEKFNIPVVYLTAFIDDETIERARFSAPEDYLIKPIEDKELEISIKMSLHKSGLQKRLKKSKLLLDTVLSGVSDGIISVNKDFEVLFSNVKANQILNLDGFDPVGEHIDRLFKIVDEKIGSISYLPSEIIDSQIYNQIYLNDRILLESKYNTKTPIQISLSETHDENHFTNGYIFLLHDNTERRENEIRRKKLLNELKAKKNQLEQVISFISNDLRTPLINIIGFSRELKDSLTLLGDNIKKLEKNSYEEYSQLNKIERELTDFSNFILDSGNKLSLMFNGLLELSNSEKRELLIEEIHTSELVENIIDDLSFRMHKKEMEITVSELKNIYADKLLLSQVFGNILDNAIKFSSPNRKNVITISQKECEKGSLFCIEDTGIGIEDSFKERIFGYFETDDNNKFKGYGLGLAIVKKIIEKHCGEIWFESEPNKGTKFFFSIPQNILHENIG